MPHRPIDRHPPVAHQTSEHRDIRKESQHDGDAPDGRPADPAEQGEAEPGNRNGQTIE
jgi:hypothetical protein